MPIPALLIILSVFGFLISFYFMVVRYRWINPELPYLPRVCRLDQQSCSLISFTREAQILGIPNSFLGMVYYLTMFTSMLVPRPRTDMEIRTLFILSLVSVMMGAYLTSSLLLKLNARCVLCFSVHLINVTIMLLLMDHVSQAS